MQRRHLPAHLGAAGTAVLSHSIKTGGANLRGLLVAVLLALWALPALCAQLPEPLRIGLLAYRPKAVLLQQWRPLADYLQVALARPIELGAFERTELESAIRQGVIDIVITNPAHFILLQHRYHLSAPLATQVTQMGAQEITTYGGVIFARADDLSLNTLSDLTGMRIAVTDTASLGGYLAQALELAEAGLPLPGADQLLTTGLPHDRVVDALIAGQARVGFVRSGVLEHLAQEGKIDLSALKIIQPKNSPTLPFAVSTRLYPEWPVAALAHVDEDLARQVTVALLSLQPYHPSARAAGLHGFTNAASYAGVDAALRTLRAAPYDAAPEFTIYDFWKKYTTWIVALGVLLLSLLSASAWILLQSRDLHSSRRRALDLRNDLQATLDAIPDLLFEIGLDGTLYQCHAPRADLLAVQAQALVGQNLNERLASRAAAACMAALQQALADGRNTGAQIKVNIGAVPRWFELSVARKASPADQQPRFIVLSRDVTERKAAETKLQLAASVFTHTQEAIIITDAASNIIEVNDAFTAITGFSRAQALGKNPRILKSGRHGPEHYAAVWRDLNSNGFWFGEMWNRRKDGQEYACMQSISVVRNGEGKPLHYVALLNDITPLKAHAQELEHVTHFDALTGLPNRVLLVDRLQQGISQSQRHKRSLAVAHFDLDGFKSVNDTFGHMAGDTLLKAVATHVKAALREGDTLARIGGDEFVVLLVDLENVQEYESVLSRLLEAVSLPVLLNGTEVQVSASIGVTVYPQDGADADQLMRHADQAMYLAKQAGKNRYHLFDITHDATVKAQREGVRQIVHALSKNEFVLHYQPKVNMRTGAVVGAEALIRWQHPERGLLAPGAFLPLIEDHSVSVAVGEWVLSAALAQMAVWKAQGLDLPVSVNIGARQLQESDFVQRLAQLLAVHPEMPPASLGLEILETSALEDMTHVCTTMRDCQAMGVTFALDDFGTGYSSLTYLRHLPAEMLKIDQSFVRDMLDDYADLAIVKGVIGLAGAFHRDVIAEGVETQTHGAQLLDLGCELAQGYGISRPMPAQAMAQWVRDWQAAPVWTA